MDIQELLRDSDDLKEKMRVVGAYRKRDRILILSVDPEVTEEKLVEDLERVMNDIKPEAELLKRLANKLKDPALTGPARTAIEDL